MKKIFFVSSQAFLLASALSSSAFFLSSCSVEIWKSNIQILISPAGSRLADKSFSQNTWKGVEDFFKARYGSNWKAPEPEKLVEKVSGIWRRPIGLGPMQFMEAYRDSHAAGANLLVCPGFEHEGPLEQFVSKNPKVINNYPQWVKNLRDEIGFIYIDGHLNNQNNDLNPFNVASVDYNVDEGGFWGGVMAGIMVNIDDYYQPEEVDFGKEPYKSLKLAPQDSTSWYNGKAFKVGCYVGLPVKPTLTYFNGLCAGIDFFNNNSKVIQDNVKQGLPSLKEKDWCPLTLISPNGIYKDLTVQAFNIGSFSPSDPRVRTLTDAFTAQGASVILPVAGTQVATTVRDIADAHKHTAVLGNDVPQEDDPSVNLNQNDSHQHSIIPYSITINLAGSTQAELQIISKCIEKGSDFRSSEKDYRGFGYNNLVGYAQHAVGVSPGKLYYDGTDDKKHDVTTDRIVKAITGVVKDGYSKIRGDELSNARIATFLDKGNKVSVISAPAIGPSAPGLNDNTYTKPDSETVNQPIANLDDINKFYKKLQKELFSDGNVNWYMVRS